MSVPRSATIRPKRPPRDRVHRRHAEPRGEHAVEGDGRAAALDVAEDRARGSHSRCAARSRRSSAAPMPPSRAWPNASRCVARASAARPSIGVAPSETTTIEKVRAARVAAPQLLADLLDVEGALGDEDRVGAAGDPGVGRDPAGVAAHHLDDHHAVVGLGGRVQPVDRVGDDLDGGLEAEGHLGAAEIVVDRLRHADDGHAVARAGAARRRACPRRRSGSARRRRRARARRATSAAAVGAVGVGVGARGAEDRAAARQDPRGARGGRARSSRRRARPPSRSGTRRSCCPFA